MQAFTGQIIEVEGSDQTDTGQQETKYSYLENRICGGGIMTDLLSN